MSQPVLISLREACRRLALNEAEAVRLIAASGIKSLSRNGELLFPAAPLDLLAVELRRRAEVKRATDAARSGVRNHPGTDAGTSSDGTPAPSSADRSGVDAGAADRRSFLEAADSDSSVFDSLTPTEVADGYEFLKSQAARYAKGGKKGDDLDDEDTREGT